MASPTPQQQLDEARQIAKDHGLFFAEKRIGARTAYLLFRRTPVGKVFLGKRGSPAGIRGFVAQAASTR